eukprot:6122980-Lingulodinium_polyedra.AAC.1
MLRARSQHYQGSPFRGRSSAGACELGAYEGVVGFAPLRSCPVASHLFVDGAHRVFKPCSQWHAQSYA